MYLIIIERGASFRIKLLVYALLWRRSYSIILTELETRAYEE
jgi:hypothetical protein